MAERSRRRTRRNADIPPARSDSDELSRRPQKGRELERTPLVERTETQVTECGISAIDKWPSNASLASSVQSDRNRELLKIEYNKRIQLAEMAAREDELKANLAKLAREKEIVDMEAQLDEVSIFVDAKVDKANEGAAGTSKDASRSSIKSSSDKREQLKTKLQTYKRLSEVAAQEEKAKAALAQLRREKEIIELESQLLEEDANAEPDFVQQKSEHSIDAATLQAFAGQIAGSITQGLKDLQDGRQQADLRRILALQSITRDLPEFSGDPTEWPRFISRFKETNSLFDFSNEENLARLIKALKGQARAVSKSLMISAKNVPEILRVLELNFGRPNTILKVLIDEVKLVPKVKDNDSASVIQLTNSLANLVSNSEALGKDNYLNNVLLLEELEKKLSGAMCIEWARIKAKSDGDCTVKDFFLYVKNLAEAMSYIAEGTTHRVRGSFLNASSQGNAPVETDYEKNASVKEKCPFCEKSHRGQCWALEKMAVDKRWQIVKRKMLCFCCLGQHQRRDCRNKKQCGVDGCERHHHQVLHGGKKPEKSTKSSQMEAKLNGNVKSGSETGKLLRVLPVKLSGKNGEVRTYAVFDDCSEVTMMTEASRKQLDVDGSVVPLTIEWVDGTTKIDNSSRSVTLRIRGDFKGSKSYPLRNVRTVKDLHIRPQSLDVEQIKAQWSHLRRLKMSSYNQAVPQLLIGIDHLNLAAHKDVLEGPDQTPLATRTKLGWTVGGKISTNTSGPLVMYHVRDTESNADLHTLMKEFFSSKRYASDSINEETMSLEDKMALAIMEETTKQTDDGRWETGLLWRPGIMELPESRKQAEFRLRNQEKRMMRDPNLSKKYKEKISEYLSKGYISKISDTKAEKSARLWYLPHFAVVNPRKPRKIRLVFDAAAHNHNVSLNSQLLTGPDLLNSLQAVLWRFREGRLACTGDIADMFHRIYIRKEDRASQRFLWRDGDSKKPYEEYNMNVMIFGATSSPSSAIFVKNKNAEQFIIELPEAVEAIKSDFYMDDYLGCYDTKEQGVKTVQEVIKINESGGFQLCQFVSNSENVLRSIPKNLINMRSKILKDKTESAASRVLGLKWDPITDKLQFSLDLSRFPNNLLDGTRIPSKREVSRLIMSIFDPLGFVSSFKLRGLVVLQNVWKSGVDWDQHITQEVYQQWKRWLIDLPRLKSVSVPRWYGGLLTGEAELHVFVDASSEGYAAVAYLRIGHEKPIVTLVASKVRVAPIKTLSIPRMELQSAVMGSKLGSLLQLKLRTTVKKILWTDSKTVLCWIRSDGGRFKTFVSNRIAEIREHTKPDEWRWVPSEDNVADDATRTSRTPDFSKNSRWFTGPSFLGENYDNWPRDRRESVMDVNINDLELSSHASVGVQIEKVHFFRLPNVNNFSKLTILLRCTAIVIRIGKRWRPRKSAEPVNIQESITVDELKLAELQWWKQVQADSFSRELKQLRDTGFVSKNSRLACLGVCMDSDGIVRLKGRLNNAIILDEYGKCPVILEPGHRFTKLLIDYHHQLSTHNGQERVVNNLRKKYWILNVRKAVKSAWNRCRECELQRTKPTNPEMGQIPRARLQPYKAPFTYTGVDYFGPMLVTVKRSREKRWGVLFTCLVTRAIHLELSPSLNTDDFIMVLMRFINRRGCPQEIYSDNGTNFRGADKELTKSLQEFDQNKLQELLSIREIKWNFIPPGAPHMGGSWERLVGLVKKSLQTVLKAEAPKEYTLWTIFTEVENIVNSRPITYVSSDPKDPPALTPNDFVRNQTFYGPSIPGNYQHADEYLRKHWRYAQRKADQFWKRWVNEYLPTLVRREKWLSSTTPVKVGDIVMITNNQTPRNNWQKAIIEKVFPGKDGIVRVVDLRTQSGVLRRPVTSICPLSVRSNKQAYQEGEMS